jgi:ClpP class serine protease
MARPAHIPHAALPELSGPWAIDRTFPLRQKLQALSALQDPYAEAPEAESFDEWYRNRLMQSGGFARVINEDGSEVSLLDPEADGKIMPGAVAVVPIKGIMVKEAPDIYQVYGICSTARITAAMQRLGSDPRVKAIVIRGYTPGGMVYGTCELSLAVKEAASQKKVLGSVDSMVASAGVFGTAHCHEIFLENLTCSIGSIGTMTTLVNDEKFWADMGIEWIESYATESTDKNRSYNEAIAGKDKLLKKEVLDPLNEVFLATVQEGRGARVKKEALTGHMYHGPAAIAVGLADGIAPFAEVIQMARGNAGAPASQTQKDTNMSNKRLGLLASMVAAVSAIFSSKETSSPEEIQQFNMALDAEGFKAGKMVSTERLAELEAAEVSAIARTAERDLEAATRIMAEGERDQVKGNLTTLEGAIAAALTENSITPAEGQSALDALIASLKSNKAVADAAQKAHADLKATLAELQVEVPEASTVTDTTIATLKEWAGNSPEGHTGGKRESDPKGTELSGSLQAAKAAGIAVN